jgi:hypothetical protein
MKPIGNIDFTEVFSQKSMGETVNVHVVQAVPEAGPDYATMQRLIEGVKKPASKPSKNKDSDG